MNIRTLNFLLLSIMKDLVPWPCLQLGDYGKKEKQAGKTSSLLKGALFIRLLSLEEAVTESYSV